MSGFDLSMCVCVCACVRNDNTTISSAQKHTLMTGEPNSEIYLGFICLSIKSNSNLRSCVCVCVCVCVPM